MKLLFLVGATGAGKGELVSAFEAFEAVEALPPRAKIATVRVGKILTLRYPLSHFQGKSAPEHTQAEAWQIVQDGIGAAYARGERVCVVDGFPRVGWQVDKIAERWPDDVVIVNVYCDSPVRSQRLKMRDGDCPEKWAHTVARMERDEAELYHVIVRAVEKRIPILNWNTTAIQKDANVSIVTKIWQKLSY